MSGLGVRSPTAFLAGAFVVAHAELLLVAIGLSLVRGFRPLPLLAALAAICAVTLLAVRRRSRVDWLAAWRTLRSDPVLLVLGIVVALGLAYTFALSIGTPQVEDDVLTFHLVRAGLWHQHHGITWLSGIFDLRNNAYPPGGEVGGLASMTLAGNVRFVALDQLLSCLVLVVGVAGIARRVGLGARQAAFGGLLVATLPIVVLQAGTAMSDLIAPAFFVAATLFLLDAGPASPWLAGVATALGMDVKLSSPLAVPLLLAVAWLARPAGRGLRLGAVAAGAVVGSFWYVVNLAESGVWDNHVSDEFHVDRGPAPILARIVRVGIEFVDLSGGSGQDRWLYAVAALVVLALAVLLALPRRARGALVTGGVAALLAALPVVLPSVAHQLVRAEFKAWQTVGRDDLAGIDPGHDITRAASNFSWYGPLGSLALVGAGVLTVLAVRRGRLDRAALLLVLAPAYWLVAFAALFFYQEWAGRFFVFPVALAAATWGLLLRWRAAAWAVTAIAATALLLVLVNDARRPSGLPLLDRNKPRSIWRTPDWAGGPETRRDYDAPIRFLEEVVPKDASVGLAITPSEPVYPFFGDELGHRVVFVGEDDSDAAGASWIFVRPGRRSSLCARGWNTAAETKGGWRILRRVASC